MGGSLRGRDFRLLVLSTGLSSLGDELALIALAIKVADLTDSGWAVAALLLAGLLPLVIFAPAAGVIVDNFETRRSLVIASALQAGIAGWLAFTTGLPGILMLAFLLGACTAVATPAIYTLAPVIVGEDHATEGNAYLETRALRRHDRRTGAGRHDLGGRQLEGGAAGRCGNVRGDRVGGVLPSRSAGSRTPRVRPTAKHGPGSAW